MTSNVSLAEDRLEMIRFFAYPREAVFAAWTDPDQLSKWWGCDQTKSVEAKIDLREGGAFSFLMHMTHGDATYEGVYDEVVVPERIVTSTVMGAGTEYEFRSTTTVEFREVKGGTEVRLIQVGLPPMPDAGKMITGGFNAGFDKLQALLAA